MGKKKRAEKAKLAPEVAAAARRIERVLARRGDNPDEPGLLFVETEAERLAVEGVLEAVYGGPSGFSMDAGTPRSSAPGAFVFYQRAQYDDEHWDVEAEYFQRLPEVFESEKKASLAKIVSLEADIVALRHDIGTTEHEIDGIKEDIE